MESAMISPLFTEYGRLVLMKKGWNTLKLAGSNRPSPVWGSIEKPVIRQDVIVSGTCLEISSYPLGLKLEGNVAKL